MDAETLARASIFGGRYRFASAFQGVRAEGVRAETVRGYESFTRPLLVQTARREDAELARTVGSSGVWRSGSTGAVAPLATAGVTTCWSPCLDVPLMRDKIRLRGPEN